MKLTIGIVGLPNVGKSTLFNALTEKAVPAENYPFCTIDPAVGVVAVPDERLGALSRLSGSEKTIPAAVEFVDIAGLVEGAAKGEGLGNQFLSHIREVDAILEVVRIFDDSNISHVSGRVDPIRDIEVINLELVLADMQTVSKRLAGLEKEVKSGDKEALFEKAALAKINAALEDGKLARSVVLGEKEREVVKQLNLLTLKPILYVLNKKAGATNLDEENETPAPQGMPSTSRGALGQTFSRPAGSSRSDLFPQASGERYRELMDFFEKTGSHHVVVDAGIEHELSGLEGEERAEFRKELGLPAASSEAAQAGAEKGGDGINALIKKSYEMLGLITFFTTGPKETRGWTIPADSTAPEAGAAIHTDFRDKFIRANIIFWKDLIDAGSFAAAREKGLIRTEGKEYVVQDGDVVEFKI